MFNLTLTIVDVRRRDRTPKKWARWYVLDHKGHRIAYFQKLNDAVDFVCYADPATFSYI